MNLRCWAVAASFALFACASTVDESREEFLPSSVRVVQVDAGTSHHPITLVWADPQVGADSTVTTGSPMSIAGYFGDVDYENLKASALQSFAASGRRIQPIGAADAGTTVTIALDDADFGFMGRDAEMTCIIGAQVTLTNGDVSATRYIGGGGTGAGSKNDAIERFIAALAVELKSHGL